MHIDDLVLISVDDHVVEPPGMFERHVPARLAATMRHASIRKDDGADVWMSRATSMANVGLNAVAGRPPEEYGIEPRVRGDARRLLRHRRSASRDMNVNGVLGSMCFPSFPGFGGQLFSRGADRDVALALLQAYNDWHIDEWCGAHPGRFIPLAHPADVGPRAMAAEVRRIAAKGCHAVTFSENPAKLGFPSLHNERWDPFWAACADEGTMVCLHIGSSSEIPITSVESPVDVTLTLMPVNIVQVAADIIWSHVLRALPDLKFALSEGGIGWMPYFLERVDYTYQHHTAWTGQDFGEKLPSQVFREHVVTCFIEDRIGIELRHEVGIDTITWECDYPHSDCTWPHSPEALAESARRRARRRGRHDRRTRTRCATSGSTRSRTGRPSSARWAPCAPKRPASIRRSAVRGRRSRGRNARCASPTSPR